jgi:hypothetical protein
VNSLFLFVPRNSPFVTFTYLDISWRDLICNQVNTCIYGPLESWAAREIKAKRAAARAKRKER